jgi:MoxR-like ATPase
VHVGDEVEQYIVGLIRATRERPDVELGASPRAAVALYRVAQAAAALAGRSFVMPDDVKSVVGPVLEHRVVVDPDRGLHGLTAHDVIEEISQRVAAPPFDETAQ